MQTIEEMMAGVRHGQTPAELDTPSLLAVLVKCLECQTVCSMCADACTAAAANEGAPLRQCIRLNQDCADLCVAVARWLSRGGKPDTTALRDLLEACVNICSSCAAECHKHAEAHPHCGICAAACERCARACRAALEELFEGPSA
jgi:hypothetical protein